MLNKSRVIHMRKKILMVLMCVLGISSIFCGILMEYNGIFIIGIVLVIGGYLVIRKELKGSIPTGGGGSSHGDTQEDQ
jgi:hypothetical protein